MRSGSPQAGRILEQTIANGFRVIARDGDSQAFRSADEQRRLSEFALHLRHQIEIDEPVPVNAGQRASERCLDGRETQIDVGFAPAAMDEREPRYGCA